MTLRRLCFRGDFFSMGLQHGESLRCLIHDLANERLDIICDSHPEITCSSVEKAVEEIVQETKQQVPELYEEIKGISCGSEIALWKLIIAGGYSDVEHRVAGNTRGSQARVVSECTLIPALDERGNVLLAGTWDSHATAEAALVLVERRPTKGPCTLALTTAGWPMQQGLTSTKLGFAIANLIPVRSQPGTTYICALPRIAAQPSLDSAVKSAVSLRLCSGRFYAIFDGAGNYAGIETDGKQYWVSNELRAHTNHYVFEESKPIEGRPDYVEISEKRRLSAERRLRQTKTVTASNLFDVISFNDGTLDSISQVGIQREDRSCAGFVINPADSSISATVGPPNLSQPEKFYLDA
jgi:hypothetical protein